MKRLCTIDEKNYSDDMKTVEKYIVRAIIIKDGLIAMQKSKAGEYKIPGGGIEQGESIPEAIAREVLEETGLYVIPDSIREIGEIVEMRRDLHNSNQKFVRNTYFFFCDVENVTVDVSMTQSECAKGFKPVWASADEIITANRALSDVEGIERDTRFIEILKNEIL